MSEEVGTSTAESLSPVDSGSHHMQTNTDDIDVVVDRCVDEEEGTSSSSPPPHDGVGSLTEPLLGQQEIEESQEIGGGVAISSTAPSSSNDNHQRRRLGSVDALRGIVMAVMILVDDAGSAYGYSIGHSPWNNVTLADFVMPFFLFLVGVSISISSLQSKVQQQQQQQQQQQNNNNSSNHQRGIRAGADYRHIFLRTIRLFVIGVILQGGNNYQYDLKTMRIPGILQRIAFCYFITAVSYIQLLLSKKYHHPMLQVLIPLIPIWTVYLILNYYTPLNQDKKEFCTDLKHPDLSVPCNAARQIDEWMFGGQQHMYQHPTYTRLPECHQVSKNQTPPGWCKWPYDPEGILPSISSIGSTLFGLPCGNWLQQLKLRSNTNPNTNTNNNKTVIVVWWSCYGLVLLLLGLFIPNIPWNKNLYTITYALFMGGCSTLSLLLCYYWIDVYNNNNSNNNRASSGGTTDLGSSNEEDNGTTNITTTPWFNVSSSSSSIITRQISSIIGTSFQWLGMNAIFVFVFGASGVLEYLLKKIYWDNPQNNIVDWTKKIFLHVLRLGDDHHHDAGLICFTLLKILFWILVCGWLYHKKWFFKI